MTTHENLAPTAARTPTDSIDIAALAAAPNPRPLTEEDRDAVLRREVDSRRLDDVPIPGELVGAGNDADLARAELRARGHETLDTHRILPRMRASHPIWQHRS